MLAQTWDQFCEIAGTVTNVELVAQNLVPAVFASARGTRQREEIGTFRDSRRRARLQRRRADLLKADHAEHLAKAGYLLFNHLQHRFWRDVPAGNASATGADDDIDLRIVDPAVKSVRNGVGIVLDNVSVSEEMARRCQPLDQKVARAVIVEAPAIRHCQNSDAQRFEFFAMIDTCQIQSPFRSQRRCIFIPALAAASLERDRDRHRGSAPHRRPDRPAID